MKSIQLTAFILMLSLFQLKAQDKTAPDQINSKFQERLAIKIEYFGELVLHPGLSIGVDYPIIEKKWGTIHWDSDLGGYWHKWNNTSVFLKTSIGSRFNMGQMYADINIGLGYMHSWAAGILYENNGTGSVKRARNWGHPHFMPNASLLFGWNGNRKNILPITIYLGPEIYLQSSFNHTFLPHVAAKLGLTYKIKYL